MGKVVVDRDSVYAPCCYLICRVDSDGNWNTRDEKNTVLVQSDLDWPSLAANLGFVPCLCGSGSTDGTVDCPDCGEFAEDMIYDAGEFLDSCLGEEFDDPGYFD